MWSRKELKQETKDFLKKYYWKSFLVCLIASILTSGSSSREKRTNGIDQNSQSLTQQEYYIELAPGANRIIFDDLFDNPFSIKVVGFATVLLLGLGSIVLTIIFGNLLLVGEKRFFINSFKGEEVKISTMFTTFKKGQWLNLAGKMFLLDVYILLWFLLLIIPGIIKVYQYKFAPYILAESPELTLKEALKISTKLTDGEKSNMFVLDLSFLGWHLLGSLFFGIGSIFVAPYQRGTFVKLYEYLRGDLNISINDQFGLVDL